MNKLVSSFALALVAACPLAGFGQNNLEKDPAYLPISKVLDLKTVRPEVDINLPRFLLKDAVAELSNTPGASPALGGLDLADLIKDVKLIRVLVIESNATNRPALDKAVKSLRADLEKKWTAIVSVPESNVGVYAMGDPSGDSTTGLAVLVCDGDNVVVGNVVGHVSVGKLLKIATQSGKVPKEFLKKLQGLGNSQNPPASTSTGDTSKPSDSDQSKTAEAKNSDSK